MLITVKVFLDPLQPDRKFLLEVGLLADADGAEARLEPDGDKDDEADDRSLHCVFNRSSRFTDVELKLFNPRTTFFQVIHCL